MLTVSINTTEGLESNVTKKNIKKVMSSNKYPTDQTDYNVPIILQFLTEKQGSV